MGWAIKARPDTPATKNMRSRVAEQVRREKRQQSEMERHLQRSFLYWLKEQVEQLQKEETSEK